jgi:Lon-like ATP-dependent protease
VKKQPCISREVIEWVVNSGQYAPRPERKISTEPQVGFANGLAVYGANQGMLLELECSVIPTTRGKGQIVITGVIEEEEVGGSDGKKMRRKSMVKASLETVLTVLRLQLRVDPRDYDIHVNFPGGIPIDGPSAGVTIATVVYSAIKNIPVDNRVAMTGETSIRGLVKPVGGIVPKLEAARLAGVKKVLIPQENWQESFAKFPGLQVIPVTTLTEVINHALVREPAVISQPALEVLSASQR